MHAKTPRHITRTHPRIAARRHNLPLLGNAPYPFLPPAPLFLPLPLTLSHIVSPHHVAQKYPGKPKTRRTRQHHPKTRPINKAWFTRRLRI
jgi:hypothetical protein